MYLGMESPPRSPNRNPQEPTRKRIGPQPLTALLTPVELGYTGLSSVILGCTGLYWAILGYAGLCWAVLGYTGLYWVVLGCTGLYWAVLGNIVLTGWFHLFI